MLVLSRKENQAIVINDEIIIKVVSLKQDQVKLGIEAPKNVKIYRQEIFEEIQKENLAAASAAEKLDALKDVLSQQRK